MRRSAVSALIGVLLALLVGYVAHRRVAETAPPRPEPATEASGPGEPRDAGVSALDAPLPERDEPRAALEPEVEGSAPLDPHPVEASSVEASSVEASSVEASPTDALAPAVPGAAGDDPSTVPSAASARPSEPPLDERERRAAEDRATRPLRVVATSWEVAAPMLVVGADGASPAAPESSDAVFAALADVDAVEEALARGGDAPSGADVAILTLGSWVESHERLAALDLEAFLVAGWSRGDTLFYASPEALGADPPPASIALASSAGSSASLPLLVVLREMGVDPARVRAVGVEDARASFLAIEREGRALAPPPAGRVFWFSSADAPRLSPWVVVAPRAIVRQERARLVAWSRSWLEGAALLDRDVPSAARRIAEMAGAPPLLELLGRLGRIGRVGLSEQVELLGLAPRARVTLAGLFRRAWEAERAAGRVSSPAPDPAPLATAVVATIARAEAPPAEPSLGCTSSRTPRALVRFPLTLPRALARGEEVPEEAVDRLAFVAGVFARSRLELVVPRGSAALGAALVQAAAERRGVDPACVASVSGPAWAVRALAPE